MFSWVWLFAIAYSFYSLCVNAHARVLNEKTCCYMPRRGWCRCRIILRNIICDNVHMISTCDNLYLINWKIWKYKDAIHLNSFALKSSIAFKIIIDLKSSIFSVVFEFFKLSIPFSEAMKYFQLSILILIVNCAIKLKSFPIVFEFSKMWESFRKTNDKYFETICQKKVW